MMDKEELIKDVVLRFFEQIRNGVFTKSDFPQKFDDNIEIIVSFGMGRLSHVPYIAFVGKGQRILSGIYPVVTYYRKHGLLFLAYGESINGVARLKWGDVCEEKRSVVDYVSDRNIELNKYTEAKYGIERFYSVYEVDGNHCMNEEDLDRLGNDIFKIMDEYKGVLDRGKGLVNSWMNLDVLGDVFLHKSTSYKYYWALSLLDLVGVGRTKCAINEVIVGMMVRAWDMAVVENRSVGGQDRLYERVRELKVELEMDEDCSKDEIRTVMIEGLSDGNVRSIFFSLEGNVPYRFLSPWIESKSNGEVERLSRGYVNGCPYGLWKEMVIMNPAWREYLVDNCERLKVEVEAKLDEYLNK